MQMVKFNEWLKYLEIVDNYKENKKESLCFLLKERWNLREYGYKK